MWAEPISAYTYNSPDGQQDTLCKASQNTAWKRGETPSHTSTTPADFNESTLENPIRTDAKLTT